MRHLYAGPPDLFHEHTESARNFEFTQGAVENLATRNDDGSRRLPLADIPIQGKLRFCRKLTGADLLRYTPALSISTIG